MMTEREMQLKLHDFERRIAELRAALRWIREAVALVPSDETSEMLTRVQQHAVMALLHDLDLEQQQK
jgi:hypothetical protein